MLKLIPAVSQEYSTKKKLFKSLDSESEDSTGIPPPRHSERSGFARSKASSLTRHILPPVPPKNHHPLRTPSRSSPEDEDYTDDSRQAKINSRSRHKKSESVYRNRSSEKYLPAKRHQLERSEFRNQVAHHREVSRKHGDHPEHSAKLSHRYEDSRIHEAPRLKPSSKLANSYSPIPARKEVKSPLNYYPKDRSYRASEEFVRRTSPKESERGHSAQRYPRQSYKTTSQPRIPKPKSPTSSEEEESSPDEYSVPRRLQRPNGQGRPTSRGPHTSNYDSSMFSSKLSRYEKLPTDRPAPVRRERTRDKEHSRSHRHAY